MNCREKNLETKTFKIRGTDIEYVVSRIRKEPMKYLRWINNHLTQEEEDIDEHEIVKMDEHEI